MSDIFDTKNLNDIPSDISSEIKKYDYANRIVELFKIAKRPLTPDEVTVAHFRKYGIVKGKRQIMAKMYNMAEKMDKPLLERVKGRVGVYKLNGSKSND